MTIPAIRIGKIEKNPKAIFPLINIIMVEMQNVTTIIIAPNFLIFGKIRSMPPVRCATPNKIIKVSLNPAS